MKTYKKILGGIAAAALILCCWGCTDEWDNHFADGLGDNGSATKTLWQLLEETQDPGLINFREVCKKAPFRTSETKDAKGYTFAHLLGMPMDAADPNSQSSITVTLFAPSISDELRDELLDKLEQGRDWEVQTQFLANHIRRNRLDIVGDLDTTLYMLNSKKYKINCKAQTFNGVEIVNPNIPATNGVMHVLKNEVEFRYNFHEYLRAMQDKNKFAKLIVKADSVYFDETNSIEGEPDDAGNMQYIDSVFYIRNRFFNHFYTIDENPNFDGLSFYGLALDLSREDSSFVMFMPSDAAFDETVDKFSKYFNYAEWYENNTVRNAITAQKGSGYNEVVRALPSVPEENLGDMPAILEELKKIKAQSYIMRNLTYNMNLQLNFKKGAPSSRQDDCIEYFDDWRSKHIEDTVGLITAFGDTIRKLPFKPWYRKTQVDEVTGMAYGIDWETISSTWGTNPVNYDPKSLFTGANKVRMSNGLVYEVDQLNICPTHTVHCDYKIEAENSIYQANIKNPSTKKPILTAEIGERVSDSIMNLRGYVSNAYLSMGATATGSKSITFRLPQVLSATYDIYVVTVPECYPVENKFLYSAYTATINYRGDEDLSDKKKGNYSTKMSERFICDSSRVHTQLLFENFKFPYSYAGLPYSYPTITFTTESYNNKDVDDDGKQIKTNNLCIDFIYLKAKED